ncbi:uncharacterized protein LOC143432437 [Xylocopa sonorina]|uniref:uncharacterized protein LOC143432437 n=1 Tax=Xylocopa sonorina TaxID=1818115 RepID=UPI00403ACE66
MAMSTRKTAASTPSDSASAPNTATFQEISRVGIRVPPFWPEQPQLWFNQIEAQFVLSGVTADNTKFYYVMSQLEPKYAVQVQDIFNNPPDTDKYETLKKELVQRLSMSQGQRIRQLLEQEEIGDRTPSQFLRHMRNLAGSTVTDDFLRTLWSGRLPAMTRAIVTAQADLSLNKLAEIADQIHEGSSRNQVASITSDRVADMLVKRLESLELQIAEMSRSRPSTRTHTHFCRRSRSNSKTRGASPSRNKHCWYHRTFGNESTKCRPPCSFQSGNETGRH